jgi:hypothetical protein
MSYSKKQVQPLNQKVTTGVSLATEVLDATNSVEIVRFGGAMSRVTFQGTDTLAGTVEFTVNGTNWFSSTAIAAANAPTTYTTHNFVAVRVTRSGGTGRLAIAASV